MGPIEARKMTRTQVHEKFKENFNALCNRCPHLADREETLDDSLTNLQWLWNLNVNISNPIHEIGVTGINTNSNHTKRDIFPTKNHSRSFLPEKQIKTTAIQLHNTHRSQPTIGSKKRNEFVHPYQKQSSRTPPRDLIKPNFGTSKGVANTPRNSSVAVSDANSPSLKYTNIDVKPSKLTVPTTTVTSINGAQKNVEDCNEDNSSGKALKACPLLSDAAFPHFTKSSFDPPSSQEHIDQNDNSNNLSKPSLSVTTLVLMALQQSKNGKLSFTSICKWIQENFPFYGTCEPKLQFLVENTLKRQKCFMKSQKKKLQTKKVLWEIDERHTDLNGIQLITSVGRKRKQTTPQKVIRRRGTPAKRKREQPQSPVVEDHNPLFEHAPELGSLKGDFNWNSIFDDLLMGEGNSLGAETASVSTSSRLSSSNLNQSAGNRSFPPLSEDDPIASFLLRDPSTLNSSRSEQSVNNENSDLLMQTVPQASNKGKTGPPPLVMGDFSTASLDEYDFNEHFSKDDLEPSLHDIFQTNTSNNVDLTITGHHIAEPPDWIPVGADLDAILCETNDLNLPNQGFLFS